MIYLINDLFDQS